MSPRQPTLLHRCSHAATAAEARFRMAGTAPKPRASRIVAMDAPARRIVARLGRGSYGEPTILGWEPDGPPMADDSADAGIWLRQEGGIAVMLDDVLETADIVVLVATGGDGVAAASAIGAAATRRGIMTTGVVVGDAAGLRTAVAALRPHAGVLLVSPDARDFAHILSALRA